MTLPPILQVASMVHVLVVHPSVPAMTDLVGGQVQVMFTAYASSEPFIQNGRVCTLAETTAQSSKSLLDVPTVAKSGLPGYEALPWLGLVAPAATPPAVVSRLHHELAEVLKEPEVQEKFRSLGLDISGPRSRTLPTTAFFAEH